MCIFSGLRNNRWRPFNLIGGPFDEPGRPLPISSGLTFKDLANNEPTENELAPVSFFLKKIPFSNGFSNIHISHIGMTILLTYVAMLIVAKCKLSNAISDKNCAHKTSKFIYLIC